MKTKQKLYSFSLLLIFALLLHACGPTDTVTVVEDTPRTDRPETAEEDTTEEFSQITIGLRDPVDNFDPLFADNLSTMRVLSLIYDGLFTLDENGELKKAIASDYSVSEDGKEYRIKINRDLFFHESAAFLSGMGRRISSSDVKWAFERTAMADVPPTAGNLLMNIEGYETFFKEQRKLYREDQRALDEVSGIRTPDNETIVIRLFEPDPEFLKKLASPLLFIYPREAVDADLANRPVGTGAYRMRTGQSNDSIVLTKDDSDRAANRLTQPDINRIDFIYAEDEGRLFQEFARGDIDWIPEVGPEIAKNVSDTSYNILPVYEDSYRLSSSSSSYRNTSIYLNNNLKGNLQWLKNRLSEFDGDSYEIRGSYKINTPTVNEDNTGEPDTAYMISFTEDFLVRSFLSTIRSNYLQPDAEMHFFDTRVADSRTAFYTRQSDSFHNPFISSDKDYWIKINSRVMQIYHPNIRGIEENAVPWKLFIEPVRVRSDESRTI